MKTTLLLLFISLVSFGQKTYEEILKDIEKHPQKDTIRTELLIDACVSATFRADSNVLKMATEANQIATKLNYRLGIIRSLNCLGNYYFSRALNDKAVNYYIQALKLAEKSKDLRNIVIGKSNLANVFAHDNNHTKAIELLTEADNILTAQKDSLSQNRAAILNNLAFSLSETKNHGKAITTYQKVLNICIANKIGFGIALTLDNLGKEYFKLKQYNKALDFFKKAEIEIIKNHVDFVRGKNLKSIGTCYQKLGNNTESLKYLALAKEIALKNQDNEGLTDIYFELQENYFKIKDFKNAYQNLSSYIELKDSLFSIEKKKTINELNMKYETEKKEAQIKDLSQQKQISELESNRKTTFIYSILGGILALAAIAYFSFTRFRAKKENEILQTQLEEAQRRIEIEQKATESELKALKSQMNPHFMFNALNSIQEQFMYGDKLKANEQMGNFTYLTRQILSVSGKKKINLSTEIEILNKYLELEKMRFSEDFSYDINLSDSIDEDYHQIPPMLIQPFVENSIKHGLLHKTGNKKLSIAFDLDETEENLICIVEDNGIGREKSAEIKSKRVQQHESFSTSATEERLRLLSNGLLDKNYITYEDLQDQNNQAAGTRVTITIPL
ncbi:MAG: tetratricopeptide repeat protein [Spirosomataceae bacterium]